MIKVAASSILLLCLAFSCAEIKRTHTTTPRPSAIPELRIINDTSASALKMNVLAIKTVVAANIATTTFDITFYNPNNRILEGEFDFPLADGQQITRYALDMEGKLREGVVVEKAKARIAFEATVRRKIDPGLVEKTIGSNFRTRIYPLPAKGTRRIVIEIEETLTQQDNDLYYQLPLYSKEPIDSFSIKVSVINSQRAPQLDENGNQKLQFNKEKENYTAGFAERNYLANKAVSFFLPGSKDDNVLLIERHESETYFYVNNRLDPGNAKRTKPSSIGIFWDQSTSAEKRDLQKEMDLLEQYLARNSNARLSLVPFHFTVQPEEKFNSGSELINRIKSLVYDGGTQLGAIDLNNYKFDEILVFSDGIATIGKKEIVVSSAPVISICSSPSANFSYLRSLAVQTKGKFVDLSKQDLASAISHLDGESLRVISVEYDKTTVEDLVISSLPLTNTGLSFAGKLNAPKTEIKIQVGYGNEVSETKTFAIVSKQTSDYEHVKRIWAAMKISELDLDYKKNIAEITKLGKKFSVVTQNTSLLVLDRVEDYVEHEIVPPAELQKEYYSLLADKKEREKQEKNDELASAIAAMETRKAWYNSRQFPAKKTAEPPMLVDTVPAPGVLSHDQAAASRIDTTVAEPQSNLAMEEFSAVADTASFYASGNTTQAFRLADASINGSAAMHFSTDVETSYSSGWIGDPATQADSVIQLKEWRANADYLDQLKKVSEANRFEKYLELKKQNSEQPSFFADVARFFFDNKEYKLALQVLSNIPEIRLEDPELLRITAQQLMEMNEKELALITFNDVLELREEHPQSYRDLALAYNELGDYDKAVELLHTLALGTWDGRFGDVKAIALNEMNAIISAHPGVNTSSIDKRLIYAMPVDVRIVIGWNADNSDVDLWVTDPNKETCSYQHTLTSIGGKISSDVTQGYGPEEFSLRHGRKGEYLIDVKLYGDHRQTLGGPITVKAELFTDFGKPTQQRRVINFRVTSQQDVVTIGSLKFGS